MAYPTERQTVNSIAAADPLIAMKDLRRLIRSENPLFVPLAEEALGLVRKRAMQQTKGWRRYRLAEVEVEVDVAIPDISPDTAAHFNALTRAAA